MRKHTNRNRSRRGKVSQELLDLLQVKYFSDPEGFRAYLPEVADILNAFSPSPDTPKSPFVLTERERAHHQKALQEVLKRLKKKTFSREEAVKGLEHVAVLIEDDSLPLEINHETLINLLQKALGKSPSSFKSKVRLPISNGDERSIVYRISVVRGVILELTWDMRLISIAIDPRKLKERKKGLAFVGIASDTASDVSQRHDDYLV